MNRIIKNKRIVRPTLLIVGEGRAEYEFLRIIRAVYTSDSKGCVLTIRDAQGKGALNVVNTAIRFQKYHGYDRAGALFDTDTDWNQATQKLADDSRIETFASSPCLEATMLAIVNEAANGNQQEQKNRFRRRFGGDAHENGLLAKHFSRDVIENARTRVLIIDRLIELIMN